MVGLGLAHLKKRAMYVGSLSGQPNLVGSSPDGWPGLAQYNNNNNNMKNSKKFQGLFQNICDFLACFFNNFA
jgi:hypothetical protein